MKIKIGLVTFECMNINLVNSSYSSGSNLHMYSNCCSARVRQQKVCGDCGKTLLSTEISKGIDEKTILTEIQQEKLKGLMENSLINVLSVNKLEEDTLYNLIPFIQKSQVLLSSIRKGWKKSDIQIFYAFKNGLKKSNSFCVVKLVQRSKEHLGIIVHYKEDLMFFELPFQRQHNHEEIKRIKEGIERETKQISKDVFTKEAEKFIGNFNGKEDLLTAKEEKLVLLKKMIENIQEGVVTKIEKEENVVVNPFSLGGK